MISIIMGVYNVENYIEECIDSIINQSFSDWELIIYDDGSTDNTMSIINFFSKHDNRIKVFKNNKNVGLAETLNHCLEKATRKYIVRHDGDDIMIKDRLKIQLTFMENNNVDISGAGVYLINDQGKIWGERFSNSNPMKQECMLTSYPFIHPTVIMKREVLNKVNGYSVNNQTFMRLEDYDLWRKLYKINVKMANLNEKLIYYREDEDAYKKKKKKYRLQEFKARLQAASDLNIPVYKRILCIKPLIMMIIPNFVVKEIKKILKR